MAAAKADPGAAGPGRPRLALVQPDTTAWGGLRLGRPIEEGNRNPVWRATLDGEPVAVRRSRRSEASLAWELDLIELLDRAGLRDLGVRVLDEATHRRAELLSDAWETANGWVVENAYARRRLASLRAGLAH